MKPKSGCCNDRVGNKQSPKNTTLLQIQELCMCPKQRHAGGSTWGNHLRTTGLGFTSPQNNLQPLQKRQKKETFVFSFKFRPHPRNHASCMHMDCLSHEPQPKKGNSTPTKMGWLEASHQKQNLLKKGKPKSLASCGCLFLFIWGGGLDGRAFQ